MNLIASDRNSPMSAMLEGFDCPAILVSADYEILATNQNYESAFGKIDAQKSSRCFEVSHGYQVPCDQAGEDCPLGAAKRSGHKERVLHIHQTPRGKEHVDVEMLPINNEDGELIYFVELLRPVPLASGLVDERMLVGESQAFQNMLAKIARVASSDASVLLLGESGTGKELAAQAIHSASDRKEKSMVTLECSGLSEALFESELFGHVKGAFTGASANKKGLVELADGGTLFLDEIGDIPLPLQVKLLRLIETGTFRAVGSAETKASDFRLICATHKNLFQMVEENLFRNDLYYRINVFPIPIPSLRERIEDIPLLINVLLKRLNSKSELRLTPAAIDRIKHHNFRGNIRELRNLLHRATVLSDSDLINVDVINECVDSNEHVTSTKSEPTKPLDLKSLEFSHIREVMDSVDGDKESAAKLLGISMRSLYRKLE